MGAGNVKEYQEISDRLARIEAQLGTVPRPASQSQSQQGQSQSQPQSAAVSPGMASLTPIPPSGGERNRRGAKFAEESPTHGSPAGAKFRARGDKVSSHVHDAGPPELGKSAATGRSPGRGGAAPSGPRFDLPDGGDAAEQSNGLGREGGLVSPAPGMSPSESPRTRNLEAAARHSQAKVDRQTYFGDMPSVTNWRDVNKCPGVKCAWLSSACAALSFVSGESVTMEAMLRTNDMALHYVSMPAVTTAEVFDALYEYIRHDRTLRDRIGVEIAHFDAEVIDEDVAAEEDSQVTQMGDRPPMMSLIQFRKAIAAELSDDSYSMHILNFDPYLVQEAEAKAAEDDEALAAMEEEEASQSKSPSNLVDSMRSSALDASLRQSDTKQWQAKNMGFFGLLVNYNAALHSVTIATPHLTPEGTLQLETHVCPLQTLYNACCVKDGYTKRTRGFIRVFRLPEGAVPKPLKSKYPVQLLDGRQSRGMLSIALDITIAPHILGLGLLHEVVRATVLSTEQRASCKADGSGIELRGIPVSDVCRRLELPVGRITGASNRDSIPLAAVWYSRYLEASGLAGQVDVGCVQVLRRDDTDDGAVNIDEDEFLKWLADATAADNVAVLLGFDVNIARNVRVVPEGQSPTHFALVTGFDRERGLVQLADVSVKKFRKFWHASTELLYRAVIGHGFVVVGPKGKELVQQFGATDAVAGLRTQAKYGAQNIVSSAAAGRTLLRPLAFEYPARNYSMTAVATALNTVLGKPQVRVEDLIYRCGFHLSFMLSEHLPLLATQRAASYYCYHALNDAVHTEATVADPDHFDAVAFAKTLEESLNPDAKNPSAVLVNYNGAGLSRYPLVWNGSFGGNLALVIGFDKESRTVYLEDSNPEPFFRRWSAPFDMLVSLMQEIDSIAERARGYIVARKGVNPHLRGSRHLDMRRAQSHHPFKNPVSSIASAVAFALSEVLPGTFVATEEVVYAASTFSLKTVTSQVTPDGALAMANDWIAQNPAAKKDVKVELDTAQHATPEALVDALSPKPGRVSLLLYDASLIFPAVVERGLAGGLVNRALAGQPVVVCDGSPTRHGDLWMRDAATLHKATKAILHFTAQ
jgi:hypothetical protein